MVVYFKGGIRVYSIGFKLMIRLAMCFAYDRMF